MKKSLNDLIEQSYELNPDVDEGSEAIGALIASYNEPKRHYVSRFIQKNEDQNITKRKHILRVMLREIIIQYGDIFDQEYIERTIERSSTIALGVEDYIKKCIKPL